MLHLYRRHLDCCPHRSMKEKRCRCPIWVHGKINGEPVRKSLETRGWEAAVRIAREWEDTGKEEGKVRVCEACDRFVADCEARKLGAAQLGKYQLLIKGLKEWFPDRVISGIGIEDLRAFRESWELAAITASKKLERLRSFFKFCMESGWVQNNPARLLKAPKVKPKPTMPFSDEEMEKILWATELYHDRPKGRRTQVKAFVMVLRHAGLRIRDAVCLKRVAILEDKVFLYTAKTGAPVYLPLPDEALKELEVLGGEYFFWSGLGKPKSAVADWQRTLAKLFKLAGIKGHAHKFRDTFAVGLLRKGVSLEAVSILLGHSDIRITQKHYAPWVLSRQIALEREVRKTWASSDSA